MSDLRKMAQVFEDGDEVHFSILEDQLLHFMSEIEARKSVERTAAQGQEFRIAKTRVFTENGSLSYLCTVG